MPQDSTYYYHTHTNNPYAATQPAGSAQTHTGTETDFPSRQETGHEGKAVPYIVLGIMALIAVVNYLPRLYRIPWLRFLFIKENNEPEQIKQVLEQRFLYYQRLPTEADKAIFVKRVYRFQRVRHFEFNGLGPQPYIRYLVSAAAVQLTFGLDDYYLWHFTTIHIQPGGYRHVLFASTLEGHVSEGNISFSWRHFQAGYAVPDNMQNVGLHEMAHALTYECFYTGGGGDAWFKNNFYLYSAVGRPIFNAMQQGERNMLGDYAAANYDEFWAVSVEAFFEQPRRMKTELPELFDAICFLLRQNPLEGNVI
jgi:MtfA peptidase